VRHVDLSLYLVTDSALCGAFGVAATVAAAVRGGATVVQLREPAAADEEVVALGRAISEALAGTGIPLLIDDRVHLVDAIGAAGAHVGQSDLDPEAARAVLGDERLLGLSAQTLEHVDAARRLPAGTLDYLGVGPVWPQSTKPDAAAPLGLRHLERIVSASPWPCVAIGGITEVRVPAVRAAGAAGVAVVSAICGQADPAAAARRLRAAWDGDGR
jgi:thiamine-phosphate pyrophosphorylase